MSSTRSSCHVVFTMDCERAHPGKAFYPPGPRSWQESEDNIKAFTDLLGERGVVPSLFATPEACEHHGGLFRELNEQGAAIGLHLHPRSFGHGVNEYLALLPREIQHDLIARAKTKSEEALGLPIGMFRAGFYSASEDTFSILRTLGFTHTSTSIARRHVPDSGALWGNKPVHPYLIEGIHEVPVTSHPTRSLPDLAFEMRSCVRKCGARWRGGPRFGRSSRGHFMASMAGIRHLGRNARSCSQQATHPLDLQIEHRDSLLLRSIIDACLDRRNGLPDVTPTLVCTTHNDVPFSHTRGRHSSRLRKLVDYLERRVPVTVCYATVIRLPESCYGSTED